MAKVYRVTLTAVASVSTSVLVEVDDEQTDQDGFLIDDDYIEDQAMQQALDGKVDWEYDGVDDDTIEVGTVRRTWSE